LCRGGGGDSQRAEFSRAVETLRDHLASDLGFESFPNVRKANLSRSEYVSKMEIYEKIVEQTRSIKRIQEEFKHLKFRTRSDHELKLSDFTLLEEGRAKMKFDLREFEKLSFGSTLVTSAKLNIQMRRRQADRFSLRTKKAKVIQIMTENQAEGTVVDTQEVINDEQEEVMVSFDLTDSLQSWILQPESNAGVVVEAAAGWDLLDPADTPALSVQSEFSLTRHRRSAMFPGFSLKEEEEENSGDCESAGDHRCCRDDMMVKFRDLQGFNFILEPTEFNAYMCRGKCPARFRPLNDHSLLQSLLHMRQQRQEGDMEGHHSRVKRPCCVPAKLSSLPILHLDEENPAKLKVTVWKSIIVTECACG